MLANLYSKTERIGRVHLNIIDESRRIIGGELEPNQIYLTKVRPVIWQYYALNC